jgi:hypothetical protein
MIGTPVGWAAFSFFWWGGALWVGASLVAISPGRGMAACATLALISEALLIGIGLTPTGRDTFTGLFIFYTIGLLAVAPLLAGGAIARRRMIAFRVVEHHP